MVAQALRVRIALALTLVVSVLPTPAATLQKLNLDDLILKSTEIVRGRVTSSTVVRRGAVLYTAATVSVAQRWKGAEGASVVVYIPGGALDGIRQTFPGAPQLNSGSEYMLFLWTGNSGITQIVGFSQGLLDLKTDDQGKVVVARIAGEENVLLDSKTKAAVADKGMEPTPLSEVTMRIRKLLGEAQQ
ncbi:MAG: hypothetical protein U0Q16_14140 [Bryobacteraceae bacterium]